MKECPVCKRVTMVTIDRRGILPSSTEVTKAEPGTARVDIGIPQTTQNYRIVEWKCLNCNYYQQDKINTDPGSASP